jgi:ADP-ribose pyrophosphatase YjhB (NUDIX family)
MILSVADRKNVPRGKWLSPSEWSEVMKKMPIACLDLVVERNDNSILYGWRLISPYRNVWALPGGRILHHESLIECAKRITNEYGLNFRELYLIGVSTTSFQVRSDISITAAALKITGEPRADGFEFSRLIWMRKSPLRLGASYRKAVIKWKRAKTSNEFKKLNRLL